MRTTVALTSVLLCITTLTYAQEPVRPIESALARMKALEAALPQVAKCSEEFMKQRPDVVQSIMSRLVLPKDPDDIKANKLNDKSRLTPTLKEQYLGFQNHMYSCFEKNFPMTDGSFIGRMMVNGTIQTGNDFVDLLNGNITFGEFNQRAELIKTEYGNPKYAKCIMDEIAQGNVTRPECRIPSLDPYNRYPVVTSECYRQGFSFECSK
jgi:hypothetical protein